MAKYTTDVTITNLNLELTNIIPNIPITDPDFTNDYWLGWVSYDNLPYSYHISQFVWDTTDSGVTGTTYLNDVTKKENVPIGYCSVYQTDNAIYDHAIVLKYNPNTLQWNRLELRPSCSELSSAACRLPNKLDINTSQLGDELWIGIGGSKNGIYISPTWVNIGISSGLINDNTFSATFGTFTTTFKLSDFATYDFVDVTDPDTGDVYKLCVTEWRCSVNDPSVDINGSASYLYQHIHPMIRVHENVTGDEKAAVLGFRAYPHMGATVCQVDFNGYIWSNSGTMFESDVFNWIFGGFIGSFDIAEWKTYSGTYGIYKPDTAVNFFLKANGLSTYGEIARIFTRDEIYKMCAIQHRFSTVTPNVYSNSGQIYAKVNLDTNEFLTEFVEGEKFRELTDWQIIGGNIGDYSFDPADIPDVTPPGPSPVDTEPKYTGDPTIGAANRVIPHGGTTYYAMNATNLATFIQRLWSQPKSFYDAIQIAGKQVTSIFDYITCLKYYPLNIDFSSNSISPVLLGTGAVFKETDGTTNYQLSPINSTYKFGAIGTWNLSSGDYHWRNNFLDYSPYTKISLYLPYVGTIELSPEQIASHAPINQSSVFLSAAIDVPTGTITYIVTNQADVMLAQKTVKIAIDLPLSGNNEIEQSSSILRSQFSTYKQLLGTGTSVINGAVQGGAAGAGVAAMGVLPSLGEMYLQNSLASRQVPVEIGSFGGVLSNISHGQIPYITIHRQKISNPDNYGHTTGYLVEGTYTINSLNGFTKCKNVDVSGISQATDKEKAQIKQIMESGFYA